jgi:hypothetical protein
MDMLDIDHPDTIPTDQPPQAYLDLAHACFQRSVEWQRRGAAWQRLGMDAMDREGMPRRRGAREPLPRP